MRRGPPRLGAADEQVQWTCESVERPERKRRAGELHAKSTHRVTGALSVSEGPESCLCQELPSGKRRLSVSEGPESCLPRAPSARRAARLLGPRRPQKRRIPPQNPYDRNSTVIIILSGLRIFLKHVAFLLSYRPEDGFELLALPPARFQLPSLLERRSSPPGRSARNNAHLAPGPPARGFFYGLVRPTAGSVTLLSVRLSLPPPGSSREAPGLMRSMP